MVFWRGLEFDNSFDSGIKPSCGVTSLNGVIQRRFIQSLIRLHWLGAVDWIVQGVQMKLSESATHLCPLPASTSIAPL